MILFPAPSINNKDNNDFSLLHSSWLVFMHFFGPAFNIHSDIFTPTYRFTRQSHNSQFFGDEKWSVENRDMVSCLTVIW